MTTEQSERKTEEITIPVSGMTCAACVKRVEKALNAVEGVESASVNLSAAKAGVIYDPEAVGIPDLESAITEIGYEVPAARLELIVTPATTLFGPSAE